MANIGISPCKLIGIGPIWNLTDNVQLSNQAEMGVNFDLSTIDIPKGDNFGSSTLPTMQEVTGRLGFRDIYTALIAAQLGSTAYAAHADNPAYKYTSRQADNVGTTPFTIVLGATPCTFGATYAPIEVVDTNGVTYSQVAPAAEVEGSFSHTAGTLTFSTADASKDVYISYWTEETSGDLVSVYFNPDSVPGNKKIAFAGKLYDTRLRAWKGYMTAYMKALQRVGPIGFQTTVGEAGTFGFDFKATTDVEGDVILSFEQT